MMHVFFMEILEKREEISEIHISDKNGPQIFSDFRILGFFGGKSGQ